jgi:hypothetical protein
MGATVVARWWAVVLRTVVNRWRCYNYRLLVVNRWWCGIDRLLYVYRSGLLDVDGSRARSNCGANHAANNRTHDSGTSPIAAAAMGFGLTCKG